MISCLAYFPAFGIEAAVAEVAIPIDGLEPFVAVVAASGFGDCFVGATDGSQQVLRESQRIRVEIGCHDSPPGAVRRP